MVAQSTSIEALAAHYAKQVIVRGGRRGFRMGCTAHQGKDANCNVFESEGGRIGAACFSVGCEPSAIMQAMERDTNRDAINPLNHSFEGTYRRDGKPVDVWRINRPDGGKDFPTAGPREGIPLLIHGSSDEDLIIVVEGEKAARAVQRAGFTSASYMGGSGSAELADYINFDWGGPQSEYDRVEAYCNAQGYSFGMVKDDVEQLVMKRLTETRQRQQFAKNMTREDFRRKVFEGGTPTINVEDGNVNITWDFTAEASALLTLYAEHKGTTVEALIDDVNREWLAKHEGGE